VTKPKLLGGPFRTGGSLSKTNHKKAKKLQKKNGQNREEKGGKTKSSPRHGSERNKTTTTVVKRGRKLQSGKTTSVTFRLTRGGKDW